MRNAAIEVVSDVVCPWCFIGKRRLESALKLLDSNGVEVRWKPFQLNPSAPKEGMDRRAYRMRKFGSLEYAQQLEARVVKAGAEAGIAFRFDRVDRTPNTFDAHRLIWFAGRNGTQDAVVERLFQAYFLEGQDVGKRDVLERIGLESGLDAGAIRELFDGRFGTEEVLADERRARDAGVNGVPAFFVRGEPVTSGAQPPELLAQALGPALTQCSLEDGAC